MKLGPLGLGGGGKKITFNPSQNFGAQSGEKTKALVVIRGVKISFFYAVACVFLFVCRAAGWGGGGGKKNKQRPIAHGPNFAHSMS